MGRLYRTCSHFGRKVLYEFMASSVNESMLLLRLPGSCAASRDIGQAHWAGSLQLKQREALCGVIQHDRRALSRYLRAGEASDLLTQLGDLG